MLVAPMDITKYVSISIYIHKAFVNLLSIWFWLIDWLDLISWREPILQNCWIISSPLLCFNFKISKDPVSLSFIRFQWILYDEWQRIWNLKAFKIEIQKGDQFCKTAELFGSPFCISILKVLRTQILHHSLDFKILCMIEEYFS